MGVSACMLQVLLLRTDARAASVRAVQESERERERGGHERAFAFFFPIITCLEDWCFARSLVHRFSAHFGDENRRLSGRLGPSDPPEMPSMRHVRKFLSFIQKERTRVVVFLRSKDSDSGETRGSPGHIHLAPHGESGDRHVLKSRVWAGSWMEPVRPSLPKERTGTNTGHRALATRLHQEVGTECVLVGRGSAIVLAAWRR